MKASRRRGHAEHRLFTETNFIRLVSEGWARLPVWFFLQCEPGMVTRNEGPPLPRWRRMALRRFGDTEPYALNA